MTEESSKEDCSTEISVAVRQLVSLPAARDNFAFGKTRDELESLLKKITTEDLRTEEEKAVDQRAAADVAAKAATKKSTTTPKKGAPKKKGTPKKTSKTGSGGIEDALGLFLADEHVEKAQNLGLQYLAAKDYKNLERSADHVDHERLNLGYMYGSLGKAVEEIKMLSWAASAELSEKEKDCLIHAKHSFTPRENGNRKDLTEVLLHLARLSSHGDTDDEVRRDRTKHFVLFLLEYCLYRDGALKNYARLLRALDLEVPDSFLRAPSNASDNEKYRAIDQKTIAKRMIVALIVGDESMETVVVLCDRKTLAHAKFDNGPKSGNKIFVPKLRTLCQFFATDDFNRGDSAAHVHEEIAHFTGGTVVDYDTLAAAAAASAASAEPSISVANSIAEDAGTNDSVVDLDTHFKIVAALRSFVDAHERGAMLTADEVAQAKRLLVAAPTSFTVVTKQTVDTSSTATSNRGDVVSPLTLPGGPEHFSFHESNNGFGDAVNGLSLTKKGLIYFLQQLRNRDDCPVPRELDRHLTGEWGVPVEAPTTFVEQALAGCLGWEKYFEILRVVDAGAHGQVSIIRSTKDPRFRAALKVGCFTSGQLFSYLSREIIDGTKVKSQYLVRCLGFFPLLCVKKKDKPFCIGMIQEECLYNLDSFCPRLERLSPREKARAASSIMEQVLKGARDLERNGITHRDIKPKNICFGKDGYWKIIDFGLARGLDENGDQTEGVGTRGFMPPEDSGPKHDVFSCSVVWYWLMTGTSPWTKHAGTELVSPKKIAAAFLVDVIDEGKQMMNLFLKMIEFSEAARLTAEEASPAMEAIAKSLSE